MTPPSSLKTSTLTAAWIDLSEEETTHLDGSGASGLPAVASQLIPPPILQTRIRAWYSIRSPMSVSATAAITTDTIEHRAEVLGGGLTGIGPKTAEHSPRTV